MSKDKKSNAYGVKGEWKSFPMCNGEVTNVRLVDIIIYAEIQVDRTLVVIWYLDLVAILLDHISVTVYSQNRTCCSLFSK